MKVILRKFIALAFMLCITSFSLFHSDDSHAATTKKQETFKPTTIDVYGTSDKESARILRQYEKELYQMLQAVIPDKTKPDGFTDAATFGKLHKKIVTGILAEGKYSSVTLSPVTYFKTKEIAMTVDLVQKKDQLTRNTFDPAPKSHTKDPAGLVKKMTEFESKGWALLNTNKISHKAPKCDANHCLFGFDHPSLAAYKKVFNTVNQHEEEILTVLRTDQDASKRASAAFLIGFIKSPEKVVQDLKPSLHDSDSGVRNNAMRVIGFTKMKNKDVKIDIADFINAINGPTTLDRNKALFVLFQLSDDPDFAKSLNNKKVKQILVKLLKLKQPNNHEIAYNVIKKLSHKNYADTDIKSWSQWSKEG